MTEALWRIAIERALTLHGDDPASRWAQLATVGPDGGPAVRTLVVRGFLPGSDALRFATDTRSAKAEHLDREPRAELCWSIPGSREQFRLAGPIVLVGADHADPPLRDARAALWAELSPPSRLMFAWPDPGAPRAEARRFRVAPPDAREPPPSFGLLLLEPRRVEHLDLRPDPHDRRRHHLDIDGWRTVELNP